MRFACAALRVFSQPGYPLIYQRKKNNGRANIHAVTRAAVRNEESHAVGPQRRNRWTFQHSLRPGVALRCSHLDSAQSAINAKIWTLQRSCMRCCGVCALT
jgi:hypothetical protein